MQEIKIAKYPKKPIDWKDFDVTQTDDELLIGGWQVMQRWEEPIMSKLATLVTSKGGDILEIGFGMGISAQLIIESGCNSYTIIEAHPKIAENARKWAKSINIPVKVIEGFWQDVLNDIDKKFDGILFDTFPLSEQERGKNHYEFILESHKLLKHEGLLTYYSDETTSFRTEHIKLLLESFKEVSLHRVDALTPSPNCEYWSDSTMIIPLAKYPNLFKKARI